MNGIEPSDLVIDGRLDRIQVLAVTTATVYGLCAAGRLPHVRILNVIRIAPSDLAAFITSCRVDNPGGNAR